MGLRGGKHPSCRSAASDRAKAQPRDKQGRFVPYKDHSEQAEQADIKEPLHHIASRSSTRGRAELANWFASVGKSDNLADMPDKAVATAGLLLSDPDTSSDAWDVLNNNPPIADLATIAHQAQTSVSTLGGLRAYQEFVVNLAETAKESAEGLDVARPETGEVDSFEDAAILTVEQLFGYLDENPEGMTISPFVDAPARHATRGVAVAALGTDTVATQSASGSKSAEVWLARLEPALRTGLFHIGGWRNTAADRYEISLAMVINDRTAADLLARLSNQMSTYDLEGGEEAYTDYRDKIAGTEHKPDGEPTYDTIINTETPSASLATRLFNALLGLP